MLPIKKPFIALEIEIRTLPKASLEAKNVSCTKIEKERWGMRTAVTLPSGGKIGLYQPTHATALNLS
jgi:hypothetical protein